MRLISTTVFLLWQAGNKLEIRELESWKAANFKVAAASWNRGGPVESWK